MESERKQEYLRERFAWREKKTVVYILRFNKKELTLISTLQNGQLLSVGLDQVGDAIEHGHPSGHRCL